MAIISIGTVNKKLLWPLIYSILYAVLHIYWSLYGNNIATLIIESYGAFIGEILTVFINIKFKYKLKRKNKFKPNYFKDISILVLLNIFYLISSLFKAYFAKPDDNTSYVNEFFVNEGIELIFLIILSHFILKDKYYIHHIISLIAIIMLTISIDIILKNYSNTTP